MRRRCSASFQAERRLRDVALEFGPYAMERQKQVVNGASRDLQDLLQDPEASPGELDEAAAVLEDALRVLNRCLSRESRREERGPLRGIRRTIGSLRDEFFADDEEWDEWPSRTGDNLGSQDAWAPPEHSAQGGRNAPAPYGREWQDAPAAYERRPAQPREEDRVSGDTDWGPRQLTTDGGGRPHQPTAEPPEPGPRRWSPAQLEADPWEDP